MPIKLWLVCHTMLCNRRKPCDWFLSRRPILSHAQPARSRSRNKLLWLVYISVGAKLAWHGLTNQSTVKTVGDKRNQDGGLIARVDRMHNFVQSTASHGLTNQSSGEHVERKKSRSVASESCACDRLSVFATAAVAKLVKLLLIWV